METLHYNYDADRFAYRFSRLKSDVKCEPGIRCTPQYGSEKAIYGFQRIVDR